MSDLNSNGLGLPDLAALYHSTASFLHHHVPHNLQNGDWWLEKLVENIFTVALAVPVYDLYREWRIRVRERKRARLGVYDHMMVISATYLFTRPDGSTILKLRDIGGPVPIDTVFTNKTDIEEIQNAMKATGVKKAILDLKMSAERRILPDLIGHINRMTGASIAWIAEMRAKKEVVPTYWTTAVLTSEHSEDHQTFTKLRIILTTLDHLKQMPPESEWNALLERDRHTVRFCTMREIAEEIYCRQADGKESFPEVEVPDYLAFVAHLAEILGHVSSPNNGDLLTRITALHEIMSKFAQGDMEAGVAMAAGVMTTVEGG